MARPRDLDRVTTATAIRRYVRYLRDQSLTAGRPSASTIATYQRDLSEFQSLTGGPDRALDDVEHEDIMDALAEIASASDKRYTTSKKPLRDGREQAGRGEQSRARWLAAVRSMFSWARNNSYVQVDPCAEIPAIRVPRRASGNRLGLDVDDARLLRDSPGIVPPSKHASGGGTAYRDAVILRLLTESGPRVSEVVALNRRDVRPLRGNLQVRWKVVVHASKGGVSRHLPISSELHDMIGTYVAEHRVPVRSADDAVVKDAAEALFLTVRGRRMNARDVQRMVARYSMFAGTPDVTPHGLRHTALTAMGRAGVPVAAISHIAGHESLATTGIYLDSSEEESADALMASPLSRDDE